MSCGDVSHDGFERPSGLSPARGLELLPEPFLHGSLHRVDVALALFPGVRVGERGRVGRGVVGCVKV